MAKSPLISRKINRFLSSDGMNRFREAIKKPINKIRNEVKETVNSPFVQNVRKDIRQIESGIKQSIREEGEKSLRMPFKDRAKEVLIKRPIQFGKAVVGGTLGGASYLGKSAIEGVGGERLRRSVENPQLEKKVFGYQPKTLQQFTREAGQYAESRGATKAQKRGTQALAVIGSIFFENPISGSPFKAGAKNVVRQGLENEARRVVKQELHPILKEVIDSVQRDTNLTKDQFITNLSEGIKNGEQSAVILNQEIKKMGATPEQFFDEAKGVDTIPDTAKPIGQIFKETQERLGVTPVSMKANAIGAFPKPLNNYEAISTKEYRKSLTGPFVERESVKGGTSQFTGMTPEVIQGLKKTEAERTAKLNAMSPEERRVLAEKTIDLPEDVQARAIDIEIRREAINSMPGKALEKYTRSGTSLEELIKKEKSTFAKKKGDTMVSELTGLEGIDLAKADELVDEYKTARKSLVEDELALKEEMRAFRNEKKLVATAKKDEDALAKITEREQKNIEKNIAKDEIDAEKRAKFEESQKKLADEYAQKQDRAKRINEARQTPDERVGITGAFKRSMRPFKYTDEETQQAFKEWDSSTKLSRELANEELKKIDIPEAEAWDSINAHELGKKTPYTEQIQKTFDALYTDAKSRGIPVPYRPNYIPHVYKEMPSEIRDKITDYLIKEKNMSKADALSYINGKPLTKEDAFRLKLDRFYEQARVFPTYQDAMKFGLTPKYTHPAQLAAFYKEETEKALANAKFLDDLLSKGKVLIDSEAPSHWVPITAPSLRGYHAPKYLASAIDGLFKSAADEFSVGERALDAFARLSRGMQEIALSAGIPKTSVNFFAIGQTIKELTRGNISAIPTFLRSNFKGMSLKYFEKNAPFLKMMADEGIDLGTRIGNYQDIYKNIIEKKTIREMFGKKFNDLFNEKTFASFMPQLYTGTFKDTYLGAIKKGMTEQEAKQFAGDITKKTFGMIEEWGRSRTVKDALSATFFAPRFRESIINVLLNTGRSVTTQLKNPAFKNNRKLLAGMVISYAAYNALNKELNGNYMWENPKNRQFALRIPLKDERVMYLEFMPSFLAFARNMAQGVINAGKGDLSGAGQKFGSLLSMPFKTISEVLTNSDYFGREIYNDTDTGVVKAKKIAGYMGLTVAHPYIKELLKQTEFSTTNKVPFVSVKEKETAPPIIESIIAGAELPLKFSNLDKESKSKYYDELRKRTDEMTRLKDDLRPVLDDIRVMVKEGRKEEAKAQWESLTEDEQKIIENIVQGEKMKKTNEKKVEMYRVLTEIRTAKEIGDMETARTLFEALDEEERKLLFKVADEHRPINTSDDEDQIQYGQEIVDTPQPQEEELPEDIIPAEDEG